MSSNNWIKTKDKLPETRQDVLFFVSHHYAGVKATQGVFVLNYENEVANHGSVFIGKDGAFCRLEYVSHWMPLPEPPNTQSLNQ